MPATHASSTQRSRYGDCHRAGIQLPVLTDLSDEHLSIETPAGCSSTLSQLLQALAAAPSLLRFLQLAVSAAEARADSKGSPSQLIAALTDCLRDLKPVTGKPEIVSAWPVLDALR